MCPSLTDHYRLTDHYNLMPNSLYLPIDKWLESGVKANGSWWVRIVILNSRSCNEESVEK